MQVACKGATWLGYIVAMNLPVLNRQWAVWPVAADSFLARLLRIAYFIGTNPLSLVRLEQDWHELSDK